MKKLTEKFFDGKKNEKANVCLVFFLNLVFFNGRKKSSQNIFVTSFWNFGKFFDFFFEAKAVIYIPTFWNFRFSFVFFSFSFWSWKKDRKGAMRVAIKKFFYSLLRWIKLEICRFYKLHSAALSFGLDSTAAAADEKFFQCSMIVMLN